MKSFIVFALFVTIVAALPRSPVGPARTSDADAQVLRLENNNIGVGPWQWLLETSNGIKQSESGEIRNEGKENAAIAVTGSYSFTAADGVTYTVTYRADENGFQPEGAHLPKSP